MSELTKFIFEGLPVRGMLVRLDDAWKDLLARRQVLGPHPPEVRALLGEMSAAGVLMQSGIKFNGALVLQIHGDGPGQRDGRNGGGHGRLQDAAIGARRRPADRGQHLWRR